MIGNGGGFRRRRLSAKYAKGELGSSSGDAGLAYYYLTRSSIISVICSEFLLKYDLIEGLFDRIISVYTLTSFTVNIKYSLCLIYMYIIAQLATLESGVGVE